MSDHSDEGDHGSSPAAWTAVVIMLVGVAIGTVFLFLNVIPLVLIGAVLIPIGMVIGVVMKGVGLGAGGSRVGSGH